MAENYRLGDISYRKGDNISYRKGENVIDFCCEKILLVIFPSAGVYVWCFVYIDVYLYWYIDICESLHRYECFDIDVRMCMDWNPDAQGSRHCSVPQLMRIIWAAPSPRGSSAYPHCTMLPRRLAAVETRCSALPFLDPREQEIA